MDLKAKAFSLPNKPGVYLFKDQQGVVLYVGKAKALKKRVTSYFKPHEDIKTQLLMEKVADFNYRLCASELAALLLENKLIKKYHPRYNVSLRDDKTYPYLKLTLNEEWPRLIVVRKKVSDGSQYFGPFQGAMVREIIRLAKKIFPLRWCRETPLKLREQPCLYYRLGKCTGPCLGNVLATDYGRIVAGLILFLQGKTSQAASKLNEEMDRAAQAFDYERAAYFRDKIKLLQKMFSKKSSATVDLLPVLKELKSQLKLNRLPERIECFDVSNISGTNTVASMVVFFRGLPLKSDYRRFKIKCLNGTPDDVAAIYEVIMRRYTKTLAKKLPWPDLVMVDGGKGQVNAASKALQQAKLEALPVLGLAKREELIYFPGTRKELAISRNSKALQLLQYIRDEAHRFAISYHRFARSRALFG